MVVLVDDVPALVGDATPLVGDATALVGDVLLLVGDATALVGDVTGLVGDVEQVDPVMTLLSRVTAPLRARRRPSTVVPVWAVMDVSAMVVPTKVVFVPNVAELPTCQKTLHAWAPLIRATVLFEAVMSVLADWKTKTARGSPCASRVRVPVNEDALPVYTPSTNVLPPSSATAAPGPLPAASS
jgi:hypothetical protein